MINYTKTILKIAENYCDENPDKGLKFDFDGKVYSFGNKKNQPTIFFKNSEKVWKRIFLEGSLGLGETYVNYGWNGSSEDVPYFLEFILHILEDNMDDKSLTKNLNIIDKIFLAITSSKAYTRSKGESNEKNINSHYSLELTLTDLDSSNNFFFPILTPKYPVYSCGVWHTGAKDLEQAQIEKFKWYAKILKLDNKKRLIDLGCGWGTQSLWYAKNLKTKVTLITLSKAQEKYIQNVIKKEKLTKLAEVKLMDMMDLHKIKDKYDAILSIGAIEHIKDFDLLFSKASKILKKDGKALFHTMFNYKHRDFDEWMSTYMWPGVQIPSLERLTKSLNKNFETISFTQYPRGSYSKTFREWLKNFIKNEKILLKIIQDSNPSEDPKVFMRKFRYYLECCVAVYNVHMDVGFALCSNKKISRED